MRGIALEFLDLYTGYWLTQELTICLNTYVCVEYSVTNGTSVLYHFPEGSGTITRQKAETRQTNGDKDSKGRGIE